MTSRLARASRPLALAVLVALAGLGQPASARQLLIPGGEGYGVADCLAEGGACGQAVADTWCESHGLGKASRFGRAEATDITASLATKASTEGASGEDSFIVDCAD